MCTKNTLKRYFFIATHSLKKHSKCNKILQTEIIYKAIQIEFAQCMQITKNIFVLNKNAKGKKFQ